MAKRGKNNQANCDDDAAGSKTTPPNAPEQGQQPHQMSNPDNTEFNPGSAKFRAFLECTFRDDLCNSWLVGATRRFAVCDSGVIPFRSIFWGA